MKCYKCKLLQVSNEQGYIVKDSGGRNLCNNDFNFVYGDGFSVGYGKEVNMVFDTIIVTRTINPCIVKELITGIEIPLLHSYKKIEYNDEYCHAKYPFGKIHTYVRIVHKQGTPFNPYKKFLFGMDEVCNPCTVTKYVQNHLDKEAYKNQLLDFFKKGEEKMNAKINQSEELLKQEKKNQKKVRQLVKDIRK